MLRIGVVCIAVLLLLPAAARARWLPEGYFQSQTGNTFCGMSRNSETNLNRVRCGARPNGRSGCTPAFILATYGKTRRTRVCGNPPAFAPRVAYNTWLYMFGGTPKLYGDKKTLRCIIRRNGLTCRNADRRGFFVRVGYSRVF